LDAVASRLRERQFGHHNRVVNAKIASPLSATEPGAVTASNVKIGYSLSSEEFQAPQLVEHAVAAEQNGFEFALISDHFHPWNTTQGNSPFVWSTLGAVAQATDRLVLGTGVTCPTVRIHPALIAQAAATMATLMPGRFFLGLGSGERLNEHIVGRHWPDNATRLQMLGEAIDLIRDLWSGEEVSFSGAFFDLDRAQIFSLPDELPPIFVATGGPMSARLAGTRGDGLIGVAPNREPVDAYAEKAGSPGPRVGQIQFCWDPDREVAEQTVLKFWPNAAFGGSLNQELATPRDFEAVAELVTVDELRGKVTAGPDVGEYVDALNLYVDAGYDHIYFHQIGPNQRDALEFVSREVLPAFRAS
jgi:G6PDH family F420-dependent oxidoreductase